MIERACRVSCPASVRITTPESKIALVISAADCPLALANGISVSVSVYGGVSQRPCNVASSAVGNVSAVFCFARCLRERAVLLSLSYWRRFHATTWEPSINPMAANEECSISICARGSHSAAAMRRGEISMRPPSLTAAAFSRVRCHAAIATEREHPATNAASASLGSVAVPS